MGCGFIKNRREVVELFQVKLSYYGKQFVVIISIHGSQLLKMLKFGQMGNGENSSNLDCDLFNSIMVNWKMKMVSSLMGRTRQRLKVIEMSCIFVELERSFFGRLEQISEFMEDNVDVLCRGRVISFCQSYEDLNGASMGCGFIENRRAAVELFQAGSDFYGKTFNVIMSIVDSQLLEKLKFIRRRNGEEECFLDCDMFNSCVGYVRRSSSLSFCEMKVFMSVNKMELVENCNIMEFDKSWFYRVKFKKRL
jgi:hypothetical protein